MLAISNRYLFRPAPAKVSWKRGLVGARGAGGHHHPVQVVFLYNARQLVLGVLGTGEQVLLNIGHVGQALGVFRHLWAVDHAGDVGAAVADENPDAGRLVGYIHLRDMGLFLGHFAAHGGQKSPRLGGAGRGVYDREGYFLWGLHAAGQVDALDFGFHGRENRPPRGSRFRKYPGRKGTIVSWPGRKGRNPPKAPQGRTAPGAGGRFHRRIPESRPCRPRRLTGWAPCPG